MRVFDLVYCSLLCTAFRAPTPYQRGGSQQHQVLASPQMMYDNVALAGQKKASHSVSNIFKLGVISGSQIGLAAFLSVSIGGACPGLATSNPGLQKIIMGVFGLPMGLLMTLVTGAELATGNFMLVAAAYREGLASGKSLWKR